MTKKELEKIFLEVESEFKNSEKYVEIIKDFEKVATKYSKETAIVATALDLSKQFTFEVFSKILCSDDSQDNSSSAPQKNRS